MRQMLFHGLHGLCQELFAVRDNQDLICPWCSGLQAAHEFRHDHLKDVRVGEIVTTLMQTGERVGETGATGKNELTRHDLSGVALFDQIQTLVDALLLVRTQNKFADAAAGRRSAAEIQDARGQSVSESLCGRVEQRNERRHPERWTPAVAREAKHNGTGDHGRTVESDQRWRGGLFRLMRDTRARGLCDKGGEGKGRRGVATGHAAIV
ncbi:MAG: hypothetical protein BJ554DRAFT_5035, partial [Olpidium bornovanus]